MKENKISVIIPMYNSEKYISKCLDSVFNQTYKNYDVVVVDDGSTDNSIEIVSKYKVRLIQQKHSGQSVARNTGIKNAKGEYFIFVDSDDYIDSNLLKKINIASQTNPDIIRYGLSIFEDKKRKDYPSIKFENLSGYDAFSKIVYSKYLDSPCVYAINRKYYNKNNFHFEPGVYHEDFGILPLVIINANSITSIGDTLYYYIKRSGSIMTDNSKIEIKSKDVLYLGKKLLNKNIDSIEYYNFVASSMITYACNINNKELREKYIKEIKKINIVSYLATNSFKRVMKKLICKISIRLFCRLKRIEL